MMFLNALDNIQQYGLDFIQYVSIDHLITRVMHIESGEYFDSMMELKTEKETYQSYGSCFVVFAQVCITHNARS